MVASVFAIGATQASAQSASTCLGQLATIVGTDGPDRIVGTDGDDVIVAGAGNDFILAGDGDDIICGGDGDDVLLGQRGDDQGAGGVGNDRLAGGNGDDVLWGEADDDTLRGGNGQDELHGGDGDDEVLGAKHNDTISGGSGDDVLGGGNGWDVIDGGNGGDLIRGGAGVDTIDAGDGHDIVNSGRGVDIVHGGSGDDDLRSGNSTGDELVGGDGIDTIDGVREAGPPRTDQQLSGQLFVDSGNQVAHWVANNPSDPRTATIASEIASKPIARWFGDWNRDVGAEVAEYVNRATAAGAIPSVVAYNIPNRDCGQHSSGGASNVAEYAAWISSFASGLGNSGAIVILEPDALALNRCAGSDRNGAIADAVVTIKSECSNCSVYLDAGHSDWVAPAEMASRLLDAGVLNSDGFFTNVSNYIATSNETAFGVEVLNELGNPAGLGQVIDTSRNGNGGNGEWCDPAGQAIGDDPTLQTGTSTVDAHLWVKIPGGSDGCIAGSGEFVPQRAFELANG